MNPTAVARARSREWPSFHGEPVPLHGDAFEVGQDFIRALHHRLCQPLTALSCTLEMMQMGHEADAKLTVQLQTAMEQSERVVELMNHFRQLFEAETPQSGDHAVLLDAVLSEVVEDLRPMAETHRVSIILEGESARYVNVSEGALRQSLWNVVENCIQLTQPNGTMRIKVSGGDVLVSDASLISAEEMADIFDPFSFCQDPARVKKVSNFPLALVQRLISAADGSLIVCRSRDANGREFHIHLPAANKQCAAGSTT